MKSEIKYILDISKIFLALTFILSMAMLWITGFVSSAEINLSALLLPIYILFAIGTSILLSISGSKVVSLFAIPFALIPGYACFSVMRLAHLFTVNTDQVVFTVYGFISVAGLSYITVRLVILALKPFGLFKQSLA